MCATFFIPLCDSCPGGHESQSPGKKAEPKNRCAQATNVFRLLSLLVTAVSIVHSAHAELQRVRSSLCCGSRGRTVAPVGWVPLVSLATSTRPSRPVFVMAVNDWAERASIPSPRPARHLSRRSCAICRLSAVQSLLALSIHILLPLIAAGPHNLRSWLKEGVAVVK